LAMCRLKPSKSSSAKETLKTIPSSTENIERILGAGRTIKGYMLLNLTSQTIHRFTIITLLWFPAYLASALPIV
jgi:hypothetical protein